MKLQRTLTPISPKLQKNDVKNKNNFLRLFYT